MSETTDPMTPRVKVHEDGSWAFQVGENPMWRLVSGCGWFQDSTNADVSGPGWRDAAVVRLVEPANPVLAEIGEARITFGRIVCRRREIAADEARSLAQDLLSAAAWAERQAEHAESALHVAGHAGLRRAAPAGPTVGGVRGGVPAALAFTRVGRGCSPTETAPASNSCQPGRSTRR